MALLAPRDCQRGCGGLGRGYWHHPEGAEQRPIRTGPHCEADVFKTSGMEMSCRRGVVMQTSFWAIRGSVSTMRPQIFSPCAAASSAWLPRVGAASHAKTGPVMAP